MENLTCPGFPVLSVFCPLIVVDMSPFVSCLFLDLPGTVFLVKGEADAGSGPTGGAELGFFDDSQRCRYFKGSICDLCEMSHERAEEELGKLMVACDNIVLWIISGFPVVKTIIRERVHQAVVCCVYGISFHKIIIEIL